MGVRIDLDTVKCVDWRQSVVLPSRSVLEIIVRQLLYQNFASGVDLLPILLVGVC